MESLFTRYAIGLLECAVDEKKDLVSLREQIKIIFEISKNNQQLNFFPMPIQRSVNLKLPFQIVV